MPGLVTLLILLIVMVYAIITNALPIIAYVLLGAIVLVLLFKLLERYPRPFLILFAVFIVVGIVCLANYREIEAGNIDVRIFVATDDCKLYVHGADEPYVVIPKGSVIALHEDPTSTLEGSAASMRFEPMCTWYENGQIYSYRRWIDGDDDWNAVEVDSMKYRKFQRIDWWEVSLPEASTAA